MKFFLLAFLMISSVTLSSQESGQKEINSFIDQWHLDATNADMEAYFDKIDEAGVYIGTDETEIWTKAEFYEWQKPRTKDGVAWDFKAIDRNIYFGDNNTYVWFDELLSFSGGTLRGSGVLVKRDNGWRIMHYVLSLPVPNEKFSDVIKVMNAKNNE
jgi:hypothetical protein